jgi:hypothetical protein
MIVIVWISSMSSGIMAVPFLISGAFGKVPSNIWFDLPLIPNHLLLQIFSIFLKI